MELDESSEMIFAEIDYPESYEDVHAPMVALMESRFSRVQSGIQSDSWIWVMDGEQKVAIDTFSSMKHQVKSYSAGLHVQKVIDALQTKYAVRVLDEPVDVWG